MLSVRPRAPGLAEVESKACVRILTSLGLWLFTLLSATGCAPPKYVLLRPSTVEKYKLTEAELKSLQFYVDVPLELFRAASVSAPDKIRGVLVTRHDITYEVVHLTPGSPCIATRVQPNRSNIAISFQPGADLLFEPDPYKGSDCYVLRYGGPDSTHYRVYGGQTYTQRGTPRLMIERMALTRIAADREPLPGRERK